MNKITNKLNKLYDELKTSKMIYLTRLFAGISVIMGLVGYSRSIDSTGLEIVNNTIALFLFAWAPDDSFILDIAKLFALLTIFTGVMSIYFLKTINQYIVQRDQKKSYDLLIGLGEQNSAFLETVDNKVSPTLVIESNAKDPNVEYFREHGFGIITNQAKDAIKNIRLNKLKNTIISTGEDRQNIAIAMILADKINLEKKGNNKKIFVRIENRNMEILFKQNILDVKDGVDMIAYSLYANMVKDLFYRHSILGLQPEIIKTSNAYNIVLIGSSPLVIEIIYYLAILANLPEENILNLYLVDNNVKQFYKKVTKLFTGIESIPELKIHLLELDSNTLEFYKHKVWNKKNLTNIVIATEDENKNIDIAMTLQDTTYIKSIVKNIFKTKILFAVYNNLGLRQRIDKNQDLFENFYTFGDIKRISCTENLIDENLDFIAKMIHSGYTGDDYIEREKLDEKWLSKDIMTPHKRDSNRTQALQIDTKLLAIGLNKKLSTKSLSERLKINQAKFEKFFPNEEISRKFPERFDTLLTKLARAEHNRWNAFHYMNGWAYEKVWKNKNDSDRAKKHACLRPFSEFDTKKSKDTYRYDVDSILNIPKYLAHTGYELEKI